MASNHLWKDLSMLRAAGGAANKFVLINIKWYYEVFTIHRANVHSATSGLLESDCERLSTAGCLLPWLLGNTITLNSLNQPALIFKRTGQRSDSIFCLKLQVGVCFCSFQTRCRLNEDTNLREFRWIWMCHTFCRSPTRPFVSIRVCRGN